MPSVDAGHCDNQCHRCKESIGDRMDVNRISLLTVSRNDLDNPRRFM